MKVGLFINKFQCSIEWGYYENLFSLSWTPGDKTRSIDRCFAIKLNIGKNKFQIFKSKYKRITSEVADSTSDVQTH